MTIPGYRLWLLLACLSLVSGCSLFSPTPEEGEVSVEPADLVDFKPEVKIKKRWSAGVGKGQERYFTGLVPALDQGIIYAADGRGNVFAVDASSGDRRWKVELGTSLSGGVGAGFGLVLVGDMEGSVYALNADNGSRRWQHQVSSEVLSAPGINQDMVIVQTQDGVLEALDAGSGEMRWQYDTDLPSLTLRGTSSPLVTDTMVIAGFANGKIVALSASTGSLLWEIRVAIPKGTTELERMVDIDGNPLLVGDVIYITSYQGRIAAMSRGTGRELWFQDGSSHQTPGFGLSQLYVTESDDTVKALRSSSGQVVWSNDQMTYRKLTAPVVAGGYVCVADADGYLHLLSQTDGRYVGRIKVDGSGVSAPMLADDETLFVFDNGGDLRAYRFESP